MRISNAATTRTPLQKTPHQCLFPLPCRQTEVDKDTMVPQDALSDPCLAWCRSVGSASTTVPQTLTDAAIHAAIEAGVQRVNRTATSRAQCVQKWTILPRDFSIPGGELGLYAGEGCNLNAVL